MNRSKKIELWIQTRKRRSQRTLIQNFVQLKMSIFSDMKDKLLEDKKEGVKMHFSVYVYYGHCSTYRVTRQVLKRVQRKFLNLTKVRWSFVVRTQQHSFSNQKNICRKVFRFSRWRLRKLVIYSSWCNFKD